VLRNSPHIACNILEELTSCFGDEFVPVSSADCKKPVSKVKVKPRLCRHLTHDLLNIAATQTERNRQTNRRANKGKGTGPVLDIALLHDEHMLGTLYNLGSGS